MKGSCNLIECQICNQNMSFGRIKRHISTKHKEVKIDQYIKHHWASLPLHKPCEVCKEEIVYKYKTCSPKCRTRLKHKHRGKQKPKTFMSKEHKLKIGLSNKGKIRSKETCEKISSSSKGISRNKGNQPMLGKTQSNYQKQRAREGMLNFYKNGGEPWTKNNPHTPETIMKIFSKKTMNKLEKFVSSILDQNNIEYKFQFFLQTKDRGCKSYDFKIKNTNILLEIDGDYWHGGPGVEKHFYKLNEVKNNDLLKDQIAQEYNLHLIRIWESEIYKNPQTILQRINPYIK